MEFLRRDPYQMEVAEGRLGGMEVRKMVDGESCVATSVADQTLLRSPVRLAGARGFFGCISGKYWMTSSQSPECNLLECLQLQGQWRRQSAENGWHIRVGNDCGSFE